MVPRETAPQGVSMSVPQEKIGKSLENVLTNNYAEIRIVSTTMIKENKHMTRKTKKMIAVEERMHQPLEKILPEMVTEQGLSHTADELGVSKATLGYWLLKLGITVRRVALAPGESLEVKRVR